MKLLVVGSGGREHAIAKKLLESEEVETVFVAPGNDGMGLDGLELVDIGISEHSKLIAFAKAEAVDWTFIGPDDALAAGIVDDFHQAGLKAFGPTRLAAELEWSKDFAKSIMAKYKVPTAAYGTFADFDEAKAYIEAQGAPIVVKADGLALGKGVVVAETVEQAVEAAREMLLDNKFGDSGALSQTLGGSERFHAFWAARELFGKRTLDLDDPPKWADLIWFFASGKFLKRAFGDDPNEN